MLLRSEATMKIYEHLQYNTVGTSNIKITPIVYNLGVLTDKNLTMKNQVLKNVKTCNYYLRNTAFTRKSLNEDTLKMLIHSYVFSRLD